MAVSATTTALSCTLGSMLALLVFLHLRGDLTGMPFDGGGRRVPRRGPAAAAAGGPDAAGARTRGRLGRGGAGAAAERAGTGRARGGQGVRPLRRVPEHEHARDLRGVRPVRPADHPARGRPRHRARRAAQRPPACADERTGLGGGFGVGRRGRGGAVSAVEDPPQPSARHAATPDTADASTASEAALPDAVTADGVPAAAPSGLPWGITVLAAGLAVETYASRTAPTAPDLTFSGASPGVMAGWTLATDRPGPGRSGPDPPVRSAAPVGPPRRPPAPGRPHPHDGGHPHRPPPGRGLRGAVRRVRDGAAARPGRTRRSARSPPSACSS